MLLLLGFLSEPINQWDVILSNSIWLFLVTTSLTGRKCLHHKHKGTTNAEEVKAKTALITQEIGFFFSMEDWLSL